MPKHILAPTYMRTALFTAALVGSAIALAPPSSAQSRQDDRASCRLVPQAERSACLREAAAAREAARKGELTTPGRNYEANATLRCNAFPAGQRDICVRRARGEGTVSGSVEGGGILREYREIVVPSVTSDSTAAPAQPASVDTSPAPGSAAAPAAPVSPASAPAVAPRPAPAGVMIRQ